ncbi:MAG: YihY family inner membrane protein, partial [Alistipes sp.]|nr:YihY family inner membrane protein [Alistipes sp.]
MNINSRINHLLHESLLSVDAAQHSALRRSYRLVYYTLRGLNINRTVVDCAALTLYSMFAIVPLLAVVLMVLGRLGVIDAGLNALYISVPEWSDLLDSVIPAAKAAVDIVPSGIFAVVGIVILLFVVFTLFRTAEGSFNRIWSVTRKRNFLHRYTAYLIIALFVPALLILAMSFAYDIISAIGLSNDMSMLLSRSLAILFTSLATTLVYKYLPFTRVAWGNALQSGIFAGVLLSVWQWGYVYLQGAMSQLSVIYGSFAAVPLFIIWLQISWFILLLGCEICHVRQHRDYFELIDRRRLYHDTVKAKRVKVVIIGSGNVAEAFARTLADTPNIFLRQIMARNRERCERVAAIGRCSWSIDPAELVDADVYIIAVSDRSVESVALKYNFPEDAIVVHTAGSVAIDAIPRPGRRGILYPFQSFSSGRIIRLREVPIFVEADNEDVAEFLTTFAHLISSRVEYADSQRRGKIHLSGVFVNNFTNHLYGIATEIVNDEGLSFDVLRPIISETASKAIASGDPFA